MTIAEKNDVDITKLFSWNKKIIIKYGEEKEIPAYIRLVGDADMNRAKVAALRKSAELRKALRTEGSDESLAFIPPANEIEKNNLIEVIILYSMREFTQQTMRELDLPLPKEPGSDAPTEKMETYQKEVDEYPKKREKALRNGIETRVNLFRTELSSKDDDHLFKLYERALINELCEQELLKRFKEYCIFFGTFSDKKFSERMFSDFENFDNLPIEIKEQFLAEYSKLEMESEELKK